MSFRICKNKHGYYKIQKWNPSWKLFGIFPFKAAWEDYYDSCDSMFQKIVFRSRKRAELEIVEIKRLEYRMKLLKKLREQKYDNSWECDGEV